jgi:hypothetical protein
VKIESVRIKNFRGYADETIFFDNYTCLVGPNGAGKSTILSALNVFFRQYKDSKTDLSKLSIEDFHHKNVDEPIEITVTFTELSDAAKTELSDYVRQDKLIVSSVARYDSATERAEVKQFGNRLGFEGFKQYFEADKSGVSAADLKNIYAGFQSVFSELPSAKTKQDMANALRLYESQHPGKCVLIPSEDQFYGASKGTSRLAPHVQWVFISADKDVSEESDETKNSALGQLLARTIRSKVNFADKVSKLRDDIRRDYQAILDGEQPLLDELSVSLGIRLKNWAHPNATAQILWKQDPDKSVKVEEPWAYIKLGERGFEGDLTRFGHGLQRSYLLTLLQVLSEVDDANAPTLIMGIEEPEIYQHPPQAKYLAEVMHDLSETGSQVIACSHSPLFIPCDHFESIRIVREKGAPAATYVSQLTYKDLSQCLKDAGQKHLKEAGMLAKLYPALNPVINEMFFCKTLILVEGIEDVAYITAYLMLNGKMKDFRKHGCHIVPVGGKSEIVKPLSMAKLLDIPVYVVCDADTNKEKESEITKHKIDNKAILKLLGHDAVNEWPTDTIRLDNLTMWQTNITHFIENEIGAEWSKYVDKSAAYYGNPGGLQKNPLAVSHALEAAWNDGLKSSSLVRLVEDIVAFAG